MGKNVEENPLLFQSIIEGGHSIGNHSYSHLNGWKTNNSVYLKDVERCSLVFSSKLYRPPYGKINASQIKKIRKKYKIIMWSILSRDYDKRVTKEKCLKLCTYNLKPGSIIVFHDSVKAKENMLYALKGLLEHAKNNKLTCKAID